MASEVIFTRFVIRRILHIARTSNVASPCVLINNEDLGGNLLVVNAWF